MTKVMIKTWTFQFLKLKIFAMIHALSHLWLAFPIAGNKLLHVVARSLQAHEDLKLRPTGHVQGDWSLFYQLEWNHKSNKPKLKKPNSFYWPKKQFIPQLKTHISLLSCSVFHLFNNLDGWIALEVRGKVCIFDSGVNCLLKRHGAALTLWYSR